MSRGVRIEAAGAAACGLLAELHGRCFAEAWGRDAFTRLLAMPGAFGLVATASAKAPTPVGLLLARIAADEAELLTVCVDADRRGRGVGSALLQAALDHAAAAGARRVYLEVEESNGPALALYRRAGFEVAGRRAGYYADRAGARRDALVLCRTIGEREPDCRL